VQGSGPLFHNALTSLGPNQPVSRTLCGDVNYPSSQGITNQSLPVNGNGFTLVALQNTATIVPGSGAIYSLFVGVQSNTAPVSFGPNACAGLPAETTCTVSFDPVAFTGTVNLQISTTASNRALTGKPSAQNLRYLWLSSTLPFVAILIIGYRRRGSKRFMSRISLTLVLVLCAGCGGGGAGSGGGGGGTPPAAPTSLTATAISSSAINLGWFPSAGATSNSVYRSTTSRFTPSSENQIANTNQSSFYPDSGLTPATTYYYALKAVNGSGSSTPSNQATASTQVFDPGTPAGTYHITVTAASGAISHSVNVTLMVQ
jgi:Fibronectin type III domain